MSTLYLTDTDSDLPGYLLARLDERADVCSLVRTVTQTTTSPTGLTRTPGGPPLAWITEPLAKATLAESPWTLTIWAQCSSAAASAALQLEIRPYTVREQAPIATGTSDPLTTEREAYIIATGPTTPPANGLADGDRLVIRLSVVDAGAPLVAGETVTVSYNGFYPAAEGDALLTSDHQLRATRTLPPPIITALRRRLKDYAEQNPVLSDDELETSYYEALAEYSIDRPREAVVAYSGDGQTADFRLPREWVPGLSRITRIEHPVGHWPRAFLEPNDYAIVEGAVGVQPTVALRLLSAPSVGADNILVGYVTRHRHDDELCTIPAADRDAVLNLAASKAAIKAAAKQAAASDPTIAVDAVNPRDGVQRWREIAREYRQAYYDHLSGRRSTPAIAFVDWDTSASDRLDRLTHPRRWR